MKKTRTKKQKIDIRNWFADSILVVFATAILLASALMATSFLANDSQDRARILRMSGPVSVERPEGTLVPAVGMVLNARDKIKTGEGAFVEVAYDDALKDVVRIGSDSTVVLESAVIQKQTNIFLDQGDILLKLEKLEKGSTFKVRTPTAVAGVRGTSFGVRLRGSEAVISDFDSRIFVKGLNEHFIENKDELFLNEGWKVRLLPFESPSRVERITDEERTAWLAWIKDIASLSSKAPQPATNVHASQVVYPPSFAFIPQDVVDKYFGLKSALLTKVNSSVSILAFVLYTVLAVNIGKVFA